MDILGGERPAMVTIRDNEDNLRVGPYIPIMPLLQSVIMDIQVRSMLRAPYVHNHPEFWEEANTQGNFVIFLWSMP